jgi:hypothetical protein
MPLKRVWIWSAFFWFVTPALPDSDLIAAPEAKRGLGRDDYPVIPMRNAIVAGVVFQHEPIELLQRELSRNPSLLQACGFNVLPLQQKPVAQLVKNELTGRMEVVWPRLSHKKLTCSSYFVLVP